MHALKFVIRVLGREEDFWASEALIPYQDLPSVRQVVVLLASVALLSLFHCLVEVIHHIAHLLFYISDDF